MAHRGTIKPAYGRVYESVVEATAAWRDGKDFTLHNTEYQGVYCSRRDFEPGDTLKLNYGKRGQKQVMVTA